MELIKEKILSPLTAKVIDNVQLSSDIYQLTFNCPEVAKKSVPGQFVSILCEGLILRRPFSIANVKDDTFKIIYKIKGKGTKYLAELKSGEIVDLIGPLGKGFNIDNKKALLVGGGVGVAPLIYLSKILEKKNTQNILLGGFREKTSLPDFNGYIVVEDGSSTLTGSVNDHIEKILVDNRLEKIYSCGPKPVLEFVTNIAIKYNIPVEVALEREFACGIGVCMGCSIQVKYGNDVVNKRICKDGPVFDGRVIVW